MVMLEIVDLTQRQFHKNCFVYLFLKIWLSVTRLFFGEDNTKSKLQLFYVDIDYWIELLVS